MLRNFIRDRITQITLGSFVATFVYSILALVSIGPGAHGEFVPHVSITVTMVLVVAGRRRAGRVHRSHRQVDSAAAGDREHRRRPRRDAIEADAAASGGRRAAKAGPSLSEMLVRLDDDSGVVRATSSGYLQYVRMSTLIDISGRGHAVIRLLHRPGHFVVEGEPLADVWPAAAAPGVARALGGAHATGPHRTLTQDLSFAVDQLVEIAIRALSPAVNDTFTALACIDWLGDGLGKIASRWRPVMVHRDATGHVRVIAVPVELPAPGRARARQDPPGQSRDAGGDDPPARRASPR